VLNALRHLRFGQLLILLINQPNRAQLAASKGLGGRYDEGGEILTGVALAASKVWAASATRASPRCVSSVYSTPRHLRF